MAANDGPYTLEWKHKPLGFSIVMDTTGKNAYVSSIQKQTNYDKGLKLAAQIIEINGQNTKNVEHAKILNLIRNATNPIMLKFQPRSFATNQDAEKKHKKNTALLFGGGPTFMDGDIQKSQVNGVYVELPEKYKGRRQWRKKKAHSRPEDPVMLWYCTMDLGANGKKDVWRIGRKSWMGQAKNDNAYAMVEEDTEDPTKIRTDWHMYDSGSRAFTKCALRISAEVAGDEHNAD